jgi:hypothetical protein
MSGSLKGRIILIDGEERLVVSLAAGALTEPKARRHVGIRALLAWVYV